jgi:amino acid adenylation domain-containing protein
MSQSGSPWLIRYKHNSGASVRLFCFHCAGGSASEFRDWPADLSGKFELLAVQLPGREGRIKEAFGARMDDLSGGVAEAMMPLLDKPYVVFGHSLGALVGFEVIRELRRRGLKQPLLFIPAGRRGPHVKSKQPPIASLPREAFIEELQKEHGDHMGYVLQSAELRETFIPQIHADFSLSEAYHFHPEPPLACPIVAFAGVDEDDLEADELNAWSVHTSGSFRSRRFPGDHFFIRESRGLVVEAIRQEIACVRGEQTAGPRGVQMATDLIRELVHGLFANDVHLYVEGSELKYRATKGAIRDADRKRVRENKAAIIEYLCKLQQIEIEQAAALPPIERVERDSDGLLPLSFSQQRLWFIDQMGVARTQYNMPGSYLLEGEFDVGAFERALQSVLERHEVLRTYFIKQDGEPREAIAVQYALPWQLHDLSELSGQERAREAKRLMREEARTPFDLSRDLMLRVQVLKLSAKHHLVLYTMHHIASDGWSGGILRSELSALYGAYSNGKENPLPPLKIQYADFAHWQRRWLQGEVLDEQMSYWRKQLTGLPPLLTLPTDRPRPVVQTFRGSMEHFSLRVGLAEQLRALSREHGVTLYMTLLSAFAVLLGRYARQQDVAVGTAIANRRRRETEGLIGFLLNTLVMRHDLSGDPCFVDLLQCTRATALQAYAHQDIPFEYLVEKLNPQRSLSHSPLFQVMFILQNAPFEALELPGLAVLPLDAGALEEEGEGAEGLARFDLTLSVQESAAGLVGGLEYNTDLLDHYARLLEAIVATPRARLSRLEILREDEKRQQLLEWNATARAYPHEKCIHQLFEAQVRLQPDAVALVHEGSELTYGELNRRANRLAYQLIERGVGPEVRVGLCLPRSAQMVIGILGILKTGGAYVPLDPNHPPQRLAYAVEDSGLAVMVGEASQWMFLDPAQRPTCVPVEEGGASDAPSDTNPDVYLPPNALAYVIYTSGSTGKPKGVRISHGNVVNFLLGMQEKLGIGSRDRLLAVTTLSFDIALLELYLPLTAGGTVDIASAASVVDAERLIARLKESRITVLQGTPVTWKLLLDSGWQGLQRLTALVGGEALSRELATRLLGKVGRIWNLYGPTEATIWSASYLVVEAVETSTVPIGKPIANTQLYVLDDHQQLVPRGTVGQLYLAGAGIAQGYLNRPGLTAERFLPQPFSQEPGERLYNTGDLARWLPDGALEFLGRVDTQVKLRGFRIELAEIESVLLAHEAASDAVVVVHEGATYTSHGGGRQAEPWTDGERATRAQQYADDKRLVGYVVAKPGIQADEVALINALRNRLQEQLPAYMVPSALMLLSSLPLTANGKLDRQALPAPDALTQAEYAPPEGLTEELLAALWCVLLKRERVGRHDNFFELGGHSMLAVRLVAMIRQQFATELPLQALFELPTIASLSKRLGAAQEAFTSPDGAEWVTGSL